MSDKLARMGVEVTAETSKFNSNLDQASNKMDTFEQELNGMNTQALDLMLQSLEAQFQATTAVVADIDAKIAALQQRLSVGVGGSNVAVDSPALQNLETEANQANSTLDLLQMQIEKVKNAINGINSSPVNQLKNAIKDVGDKAVEAGAKTERSMNKSMKTITKLGALLIGVRTIYSVITRAVQSYLNRNEALRTQIDSMYVAMGSLLAPAIQSAVNWMSKFVQITMIGVAYITTFINALFGLNMAINRNANSASGLNNNLKKTSKTMKSLSGIDELNALNSGSAADASASTQVDLAAYDVSDKLTGLDEFGNKLESLRIILAPLTVLLALTAVSILALASPISGIVIGIGLMIATVMLVISVWDTLTEGQKTALKILGAVVAIIGLVVLGMWAWNTVQAVLNGTMLLNPIGLIVLAIAALIAIIVGLIVYWDDVKKAVVNFASIAANALKNLWNGMVSAAKGPINMVLGFVNAIISGINFLIRGLNSVKFTAPDWFKYIGLGGVAGKTFGVNIPTIKSIPLLASGAVTSGPTMAMIGEGRYDEAVVPLGRSPQFRDMKKEIADEVSKQSGGSGTVVKADIYLGETLVGSALIDTINRTSKLTGKTVVQY